jgi:CDP-glycerol glycerophosphotransferase (TagB/SpsB family)
MTVLLQIFSFFLISVRIRVSVKEAITIINYLKPLAKTIYLLPIKWLSKVKRKKNNHIVFFLSFPSSSEYILDKLIEKYRERVIICYTKNCAELAQRFSIQGNLTLSIDSLYDLYTKVIPVLGSSKMILCDNYFPLLAEFNFDKEVSVVQLWHANGAIKKFGLEANYVSSESNIDKKRYQAVYNRFTHLVVSSPMMAKIFCKSYAKNYGILPFGYPLTDQYFSDQFKNELKFDFIKKPLVLYAPTYRETERDQSFSLEEFIKQIPSNLQLIIHPHPHDNFLRDQLSDFPEIIQLPKGVSLTSILSYVDYLVTDYSSIPFEYSLANPNGQIIYFWYDYKTYSTKVGIQELFEKYVTGTITYSHSDLKNSFLKENKSDLKEFNSIWNTFADGRAMKQLIDWIDKQYEN